MCTFCMPVDCLTESVYIGDALVEEDFSREQAQLYNAFFCAAVEIAKKIGAVEIVSQFVACVGAAHVEFRLEQCSTPDLSAVPEEIQAAFVCSVSGNTLTLTLKTGSNG